MGNCIIGVSSAQPALAPELQAHPAAEASTSSHTMHAQTHLSPLGRAPARSPSRTSQARASEPLQPELRRATQLCERWKSLIPSLETRGEMDLKDALVDKQLVLENIKQVLEDMSSANAIADDRDVDAIGKLLSNIEGIVAMLERMLKNRDVHVFTNMRAPPLAQLKGLKAPVLHRP